MNSKVLILTAGIAIGLSICFVYSAFTPKAEQIGENSYFVDGKYFVFYDAQNGLRVFEKNSQGLSSRVSLPGPNYSSNMIEQSKPTVMQLKQGEIVQLNRTRYDSNSVDVDFQFYRYDGTKLIQIPLVKQ